MKKRSAKAAAPSEQPTAPQLDLDRTIATAIDACTDGLEAIRKRINTLANEPELGREDSSHLAWLTKQVAQIMGDVRKRQEQEQRRLSKLSPAIVLAYLRQLEPEQRSRLLREAQNIDAGGSVLG